MRRVGALVVALWWVTASLPAHADEQQVVPVDVQVAIFKKVFGYDRSFEGRSPSILVVVPDDRPRERAEMVASAFARLGFLADVVEEEVVAPRLGSGVVAYLLSAPRGPLLDELARTGVLSISGDPDLAVRGVVTIALRRKADGRTEILVHLPRARAERHDFSSYLLSISTIVK